MTFFESLVALMLLAVLLLQVARRLGLPYPAMLALAGLAVTALPGAPDIRLAPQTALALFVAPVLLDAAFDFPLAALRRFWRQLLGLAVFALAFTATCVGLVGWWVGGLPLAAALALGAIVAPPDAAAATAMLRQVGLPRSTMEVLQGESLLNDAVALLLFSAALAVQEHGGIDGSVALTLGLAAPGGLLLGIGAALLYRRLMRFLRGTLGGDRKSVV